MIRKTGLSMAIGLAATALTFAQAPDNSKANQHQAQGQTADKQSNRKADMELTRSIRSEVVKIDALSTYAKNVKIVTRNGHVTLVGPVRTEDEKTAIETVAKKAAGDEHVTSKLTVTPGS